MRRLNSMTMVVGAASLVLALLGWMRPACADLDPALPEPLLTQGTLPPEEADGPFQYWRQHKKYFLVIAVDQTDVPQTTLPFAQVDGRRVVEALTALGYEPLDPAHPLLTGKAATASAIMGAMNHARRGKHETDTILVYYTGHGAVGPTDLWLQTAGQNEVGDGQGVAISGLIIQARRTAREKAFEGELVLIIDACYSGHGTVSEGLTLANMGRRTTLFTSSTDIQESFALTLADLPKMSAFTHTLLQGLGPDWAQSDSDHDGLLRWEELKLYATDHLRTLAQRSAVAKPMTPSLLTDYTEGLAAYRRDQVRIWRSPYRARLTTQAMNDVLAAHLQTLGTRPTDAPVLPQEARALAQLAQPAADDYYAQAVKATAQGDAKTARVLFAKADQQSQARQATAAAAQQQEQENQGKIALARARMETYEGKFTEAFTWYQRVAQLTPPTTSELLNEIGGGGWRAGKYAEAEPYLTRALQQREQTLDPNHPEVAESLNNLALLYYAQGKYAEAEPLFIRALTITEAALGPTHPQVATRLNNLAGLYYTQGQYAEAESLFHRALKIDETALGPTHLHVATDLNNLALVYQKQGNYPEAKPLYQRALTITEAALGPTHPEVAISLNNLAGLYDAQSKYAEAEPLYHRALTITEAALGPTHPEVATSLNNLADLYREQARYAEAEPLLHRAITIDEAALGPTHPTLAAGLNNLALLYYVQKKYAEAEPLFIRALTITEAALGPTHPAVAIRLTNLAVLYHAQGKYAQAEPLYQRSFWIRYPRLGLEHPTVAQSLAYYQALLKASGQPHDEKDVMAKLQAFMQAPRAPHLTP
ncbi:MAG: tetratricopeptide repeat protein [Nitrospira sp. CR2.1]|nr:tetratricopeptide repeat protein [Nitrospira sp. CR2.1]